MKQTSIEWLYNELSKYVIHKPTGLAEWEVLKELTQQAKAMEKEQLINAWMDGMEGILHKIAAEQYYNETYGQGSNLKS